LQQEEKDNSIDSTTDRNIVTNEIKQEEILTRRQRLSKWFKNKIKDMSSEYKYNFFLRMGIELFLEVFVLSLLNLRYATYGNFYQVASTALSGFFI